jgi:hypothetical protein
MLKHQDYSIANRTDEEILDDGENGKIVFQTVSGWLPTAAARGSSPGLVMWDLWWTKWRWGRFSPSTSVPLANLHSTNCSTITLIYHLGLVQ